jgi:hypothetical protein
MENKHTLLAGKIAEILQAGMVLYRKGMDYIDSTLACPSADEFARILSDPDNCEADPVLELLFFPDEEIQEKLEPVLKQNKYSDRDVFAIIDLLTRKQLQTKIRFPENRGHITIRIPDSAICQFVYRLNITRHINQKISQTLIRCIRKKKEIHRVRVQLRNTRFSYSGKICSFLSEFIEKIYPLPGFFKDALPFMLDFLDQIKPETGIYPALIKKKRLYVQMIRQSEKIERALKEHSVEALMLKGMPIPAINIEETQKKIAIIDRVCTLIYKRTDSYGAADPVSVYVDPGRRRL